MTMDNDPLLDGILDLEEEFYAEGYTLGVQDGEKAGYHEGSVFAVEKGFEKFQELGRLYGKGIIWAKRLPGQHDLVSNSGAHKAGLSIKAGQANESNPNKMENKPDSTIVPGINSVNDVHLPLLPSNTRLEKHITTFLSLVDPLTLSLKNTEEDVADFDDRLRRATAKAKVIEKILGEQSGHTTRAGGGGIAAERSGTGNIEDIGPLPAKLSSAI